MVELVEVEPGKWRVKRPPLTPARSNLPLPNVISDHMEPTEQVDGRFYTSKSAFRAVGKANGLVEIGNEKLPTIEAARQFPESQQGSTAAVDQDCRRTLSRGRSAANRAVRMTAQQ